jgi:hypothetical protein
MGSTRGLEAVFNETNPPTLKKEEAYREVAALRDDGQVEAEPRVHRAVLEEALLRARRRHDVAGA